MSIASLLASHIAGRPGRPPSFSMESLDMVCAIIAERGFSDNAAASLAGVSTSSLGRWKKKSEEVRLALLQARQEFRVLQLDQVLEASRTPRGWRAAAWLLERVFPEEYSPRAAEREKFQDLAARREAEYEQPDAALAEATVAASSNSAEAAVGPQAEPPTASASVGDSHNSQNSAASAPSPTTAEARQQATPVNPTACQEPAEKPASTAQQAPSASEQRSQNSQNSVADRLASEDQERRVRSNEVAPVREPGRRAA